MDKAKAVNFLRAHSDVMRLTDKEICRELKKAGIVSRTTYYRDCNISRLVAWVKYKLTPESQR